MRADQAHRDDIGRRHAALVLELEEVVLCVAFHVCLGPPDRSCDGRPVAAPGGRVLQRSQKLAVLLVRPLGSRCVLWHAPSRRLDSHETMWQKRRQRPTLLETRHAPSPRSLRPRFSSWCTWAGPSHSTFGASRSFLAVASWQKSPRRWG